MIRRKNNCSNGLRVESARSESCAGRWSDVEWCRSRRVGSFSTCRSPPPPPPFYMASWRAAHPQKGSSNFSLFSLSLSCLPSDNMCTLSENAAILPPPPPSSSLMCRGNQSLLLSMRAPFTCCCNNVDVHLHFSNLTKI